MRKKTEWNYYFSSSSIKKILLMSKITFILLFVGLLQVSGASYAQITKLDLLVSDVSIIELFEKIESQSEFRFFYDNSQVDLKQKVSVEATNRKVEDVLEDVLKNTNITYEVLDRHILISPKGDKNSQSQSQDVKRVRGTVRSATDNTAIPGVTVMVKGTAAGTITDQDGNYDLTIPAGGNTLVFSFIGMASQEIAINNQSTINCFLQENVVGVDEVVVIGYGTVKKSDLTGSVAVITTKELLKNPAPSAAQALQGKATGVLVTQSGEPGGGATIRIRGIGSINKGSDPIFIVDGVQVGGISGIQPYDIESFQVLKDASATAIYGANGSNGVIIITTKRGKPGKTQVNLNTYLSFNRKPTRYDVMNADQYSAFYTKINGEMPEYQQAFREKYYGEGWQEGTDWQDQLFRNSLSKNINLSLAGGGENSNFNVSLNYVKDEGTIIKSNNERFNIRANSDFKLSRYLKIGENISISRSSGESPMTVQSSIWDLIASPLMKINNPFYKGGFENYQAVYWEDENGNFQQGRTPEGYSGPLYSNTLGNDKPNPLAAPSLGDDKDYHTGINVSVYAQVDFTDWLMFKITPAVETGNGRERIWMPSFDGNRSSGTASLTEKYSESITFNLENQLLFKKVFNNVHNVQATAVYQLRSNHNNSLDAAVNGFSFEQLNTLTNGGTDSKSLTGYTNDYRMLSYLGRVMYDYKGKYYLTASYRSDGVSVFAPAFRRGNFFSSSVAWKINEDFFKDVKEIDALKLRLGWGQTGNSDIGGGFQYLDQIAPSTQFSPVFGTDQHIAQAQYVFYNFASKEIHWESAEMYNFGLDLGLWKNRLQFSAEYYIKNNNDLLIAVPISAAFGRIDGRPWFNTGNIQNKGVEISLQWSDQIGDFSYGFNTNLTTIANQVKYMPVSDITTDYNRTVEGHSIGALYGLVSEGIIQLNDDYYTRGEDGNFQYDNNGFLTGYKYAQQNAKVPQPGDLRYSDLNADGKVDNLDKTIIGKTIPSYTYTLGFDCSYKNFDFNIFLFGVGDFDIFNAQRAKMMSMNNQDMDHNKFTEFGLNHWTEENQSTTNVRLDKSNRNSNDQMSSFWVEDGSFLRVKDLQLGYRMSPENCTKIGIGSARVYLNASNLYNFTSYKGRDPEPFTSGEDPISSGTDNGTYSIPRSFTVGLQIEF
jgi:TonB-linked SusC/RagA family outer membrane protein